MNKTIIAAAMMLLGGGAIAQVEMETHIIDVQSCETVECVDRIEQEGVKTMERLVVTHDYTALPLAIWADEVFAEKRCDLTPSCKKDREHKKKVEEEERAWQIHLQREKYRNTLRENKIRKERELAETEAFYAKKAQDAQARRDRDYADCIRFGNRKSICESIR